MKRFGIEFTIGKIASKTKEIETLRDSFSNNLQVLVDKLGWDPGLPMTDLEEQDVTTLGEILLLIDSISSLRSVFLSSAKPRLEELEGLGASREVLDKFKNWIDLERNYQIQTAGNKSLASSLLERKFAEDKEKLN